MAFQSDRKLYLAFQTKKKGDLIFLWDTGPVLQEDPQNRVRLNERGNFESWFPRSFDQTLFFGSPCICKILSSQTLVKWLNHFILCQDTSQSKNTRDGDRKMCKYGKTISHVLTAFMRCSKNKLSSADFGLMRRCLLEWFLGIRPLINFKNKGPTQQPKTKKCVHN